MYFLLLPTIVYSSLCVVCFIPFRSLMICYFSKASFQFDFLPITNLTETHTASHQFPIFCSRETIISHTINGQSLESSNLHHSWRLDIVPQSIYLKTLVTLKVPLSVSCICFHMKYHYKHDLQHYFNCCVNSSKLVVKNRKLTGSLPSLARLLILRNS